MEENTENTGANGDEEEVMEVGEGDGDGDGHIEENLETALVPVDPAVPNQSWADVAATNKDDTVVDILRIVLKKTEKSGSFFLSDVEKSRLVFRQLGVSNSDVVGIDQEDFRTIRVHLTCPAEGYKIAHSLQVKDGLVTLPMRMFRRLTKVFISRVGVRGDVAEVEEMLGHFGSVEETIRWRTYYNSHQNPSLLTEDEKLLLGIKTGDVETKMYIESHIPSFCLLPSAVEGRSEFATQRSLSHVLAVIKASEDAEEMGMLPSARRRAARRSSWPTTGRSSPVGTSRSSRRAGRRPSYLATPSWWRGWGRKQE